ncbi:MAG: hypothetical protein IPL65_09805 [Lewinellaceae bacterium]|nr:hypothetical protein [Lewinellaceae bacterium]
MVRSLRSYQLMERIVMLLGLVVPYFLTWSWMFWTDRTAWFWQQTLSSIQFDFGLRIPDALQDRAAMGLLAFILLTLLFNISAFYFKRLMQVQKYITGLFYLILTALVAMLVFRQPFQWQYLLMAPAMGVLTGIIFNDLRNRLMAEVLHLLLLAGLFFVLFNPQLF